MTTIFIMKPSQCQLDDYFSIRHKYLSKFLIDTDLDELDNKSHFVLVASSGKVIGGARLISVNGTDGYITVLPCSKATISNSNLNISSVGGFIDNFRESDVDSYFEIGRLVLEIPFRKKEIFTQLIMTLFSLGETFGHRHFLASAPLLQARYYKWIISSIGAKLKISRYPIPMSAFCKNGPFYLIYSNLTSAPDYRSFLPIDT